MATPATVDILPTFEPMGDQAILIRFSENAPSLADKLMAIAKRLDDHAAMYPAVTEWSLGYDVMAVFYDPLKTPPHMLIRALRQLVSDAFEPDHTAAIPDAEAVMIPVCYGGVYGPDLEEVASSNSLTPEDVVRLHEEALYRVVLLGFAPGFPYLEGLHPRLATPRKTTPRRAVPKGSVGIAGRQTGIYSFQTPGGWQIIGRTPRLLFDVRAEVPTLLRPGSFVRFQSVTEEEFDAAEKSSS